MKKNESIASIAAAYGHMPQTIWQQERNAELRVKRENGYVLMRGDEVWIPDLQIKALECETGRTHRFGFLGGSEVLHLRFGDADFPRTHIPYLLTVDGISIAGKTDDKGVFCHHLPPDADQGRLILRPPGKPEEHYELQFHRLDPATELSGVKQRLRNLGYYSGIVDGVWNQETQIALRAFQVDHGLEPATPPDEATRTKLVQIHGC